MRMQRVDVSEIRDYKTTVNSFAAVCFFCTRFALKKTAFLFGPQFSAGVFDVVMREFYIDNGMTFVNFSKADCVVY